jgi:integrase
MVLVTNIYRIPHYPFVKYKVGEAPATAKRNLTVDKIKDIRDTELDPGSRSEFARDMFMLSFYLCGMNAKDFYLWSDDIHHGGRISYNRSKTKGKRKDKAFISIQIPDEATPIIEKYMNTLSLKYAGPDNLNKALNKGLEAVASNLGIPKFTFYYARHSFGTIARNVCRFSKDDVALALNHVDQNRKTTDIYIEPSWDIIDEVQAGVLALLKES